MTTGAVALVSVVAALAFVAACDGDGGDSSRWSATVAGLCTAADQARSGDTTDARRIFFDESHDTVHRLADRASERDRGAAALLLEAKEEVEAGLDDASPSLATDLDALVDATRAAVRVTGDPVPPPCSE